MRFIISVTADVQLKLIGYRDCQSSGPLNSVFIQKKKKNSKKKFLGEEMMNPSTLHIEERTTVTGRKKS